MEKKLLFILFIILVSCDPPAYFDYFIINECSENINVYFVDQQNKSHSFEIKPTESVHVLNIETIQAVSNVHYFFKEIVIKKGEKRAKLTLMSVGKLQRHQKGMIIFI
jgi:hypothetical protein